MRSILKYCPSVMVAVLFLSASAQAVVVAYYTFDEGFGNTAFDNATDDGEQNAVTNQGTIGWTTGIIGGALDLPGTASLQAMDAIGAGATSFTLSAWVNMDDTPGYDGIYMARRPASDGAAANQENWGLAVEGGSVENLHFDFRYDLAPVGTGGSNGVDSPLGSAVIDVWTHIAMTWSTESDPESPNYARFIYVNGVNVGAPPQPNMLDDAYNGFLSTWNIGDDPCCGGRELNAQLDDLVVWRNEALSEAQILAIYNNGLQGIPAVPPSGILGDVNGDTLVNSVDFETIRANFYQSFVDREDGDLVNSSFIDFRDYGQWKQVSPKDPDPGALASAQVPEPSSLLLLAAAIGVGLLRRR